MAPRKSKADKIAERRLQVAYLTAHGFTQHQIALRLDVSDRTVWDDLAEMQAEVASFAAEVLSTDGKLARVLESLVIDATTLPNPADRARAATALTRVALGQAKLAMIPDNPANAADLESYLDAVSNAVNNP